MLEVHAPHEATHSWKDFVVHIVTIVIGLLIAVALEQTVEHFHNQHIVAATREALRQERENNRAELARWAVAVRREHASLENNLLVLGYLKQHPGTRQEQLPGILTWHSATDVLNNAAWNTAQQTQVTGLMPAAEVREWSNFYMHIEKILVSNQAYWEALNDARQYAFRDPDPSHLTPPQIDQVLDGTARALKTLYLQAVTMTNVNDDFPGFLAFSEDDVNSIANVAAVESNPALAGPKAQTIQRIDAAGKQKDYFPQATAPSR